MKIIHLLLLAPVVLATLIALTHAHGRLISPAARGAAWRFGFQTPVNYNDEGLYCGGYSTQWRNRGKCGVCGDAYTSPKPRDHELFGHNVKNPPVIVGKYKQGEEIEVKVHLTANHGGFFVFQLCAANNQKEVTEECLQNNPLVVQVNGSFEEPEMPKTGINTVDDEQLGGQLNEHAPRTISLYPMELKTFIQTVKNPFNEDKYNYDLNETDVQNANALVIAGEPSVGNRFNPVLSKLDHELKPFKYPIPFEKARVYTIKVKLPAKVKCQRCVLRWIYVAGNSWGICEQRTQRGKVGCGPQEEFRNCADISIQ